MEAAIFVKPYIGLTVYRPVSSFYHHVSRLLLFTSILRRISCLRGGIQGQCKISLHLDLFLPIETAAAYSLAARQIVL